MSASVSIFSFCPVAGTIANANWPPGRRESYTPLKRPILLLFQSLQNTRSYWLVTGKVLSLAWTYSILLVEYFSLATCSLSPSGSTATTFPSAPTFSAKTFVSTPIPHPRSRMVLYLSEYPTSQSLQVQHLFDLQPVNSSKMLTYLDIRATLS